MVIISPWLLLCYSNDQSATNFFEKVFQPYLINTRTTKREIDSKPIYNMIENSAESPSNSADDQLCFSGQSADKKTFSSNKDSFTLILILYCRLCGHTMRIAG